MKAGWELPNCPGGCGKLHRKCCDSVIGEPHQSVCPSQVPYVAPPRPRWGYLWRRP